MRLIVDISSPLERNAMSLGWMLPDISKDPENVNSNYAVYEKHRLFLFFPPQRTTKISPSVLIGKKNKNM